MKININLDESEIYSILKNIVEDESIRELIHGLVITNPLAVEWLVKFNLGVPAPIIPNVNTPGYIKLDSLSSWSPDTTAYEKSSFVTQGYLPVVVKSFRGLHSYYPLTVEAPPLINENGDKVDNTFHVELTEFYPDSELDPYDISVVKEI